MPSTIPTTLAPPSTVTSTAAQGGGPSAQEVQIVCPFCLDALDISKVGQVKSHLAATHSFHVPHSHAIVDWPGLLLYLETKIHDLGHCLHCHAAYWNPHWTPDMVNSFDDADYDEDDDEEEEELPEMRDAFRSGQDAIKHMFATGHNALRIECGGWREYATFYRSPKSLFVPTVSQSHTPSPPSSISSTVKVDSSTLHQLERPVITRETARLISGSRRSGLTRHTSLAVIGDSSDQPPPRVQAVIRAGDGNALAQSLAVQHSIPVHQANKLVRSGVQSTALATMPTAQIRHLAKTMEQAEKSSRRQEMKDFTAQAVKANKSGRKRMLHVRPKLEPHTFNPALIN